MQFFFTRTKIQILLAVNNIQNFTFIKRDESFLAFAIRISKK